MCVWPRDALSCIGVSLRAVAWQCSKRTGNTPGSTQRGSCRLTKRKPSRIKDRPSRIFYLRNEPGRGLRPTCAGALFKRGIVREGGRTDLLKCEQGGQETALGRLRPTTSRTGENDGQAALRSPDNNQSTASPPTRNACPEQPPSVFLSRTYSSLSWDLPPLTVAINLISYL